MRIIKMNEFKGLLDDEGFLIEKTSKNLNGVWKSAWWVDGLNLASNWRAQIEKDFQKKQEKNIPIYEIMSIYDVCDVHTTFPTRFFGGEPSIETEHERHKRHKTIKNTPQKILEEEVIDHSDGLIHLKCTICGETPCTAEIKGRPYCGICAATLQKNMKKTQKLSSCLRVLSND